MQEIMGIQLRLQKVEVVEYSGWISGYGNTIILGHGNGVQTLYLMLRL